MSKLFVRRYTREGLPTSFLALAVAPAQAKRLDGSTLTQRLQTSRSGTALFVTLMLREIALVPFVT